MVLFRSIPRYTDDPYDGLGDEVIYNINVDWTSNNAVFKVRYSDDVAGNVIEVYLVQPTTQVAGMTFLGMMK